MHFNLFPHSLTSHSSLSPLPFFFFHLETLICIARSILPSLLSSSPSLSPMATARDGNPYESAGLGAGGKFRKRPFRRNQTTPYDRPPPPPLRNPSTARSYGWLSKLVDPAQRLITTGAHMLFSSVFRKRLPPPPPPNSQPLGSFFVFLSLFPLQLLGLAVSFVYIYCV